MKLFLKGPGYLLPILTKAPLFYLNHSTQTGSVLKCTTTTKLQMSKGKATPVTGGEDLKTCEMSILPHFL
jgi:hypothetical protein